MPLLRARPGLATDLVLMGVALVWGSSYLVAKDLTLAAPILVVLALRYAISAVALGLVCRGTRTRLPGRRELAVGVVLGLTQAAVLTLETFGVSGTTATNAGLIISLTVVFTPLLDSLWRRSPMPAPFFVATALAVVGVALLVSGDGFRAPGWGDGLMLAAAAVRAVHVSLIGRLTAGRPSSSLMLTTVQAVVGTVVLSAAAAPALGPAATHLPAAAWAQLAYLALACTVFAFLAQTWAIRRTSASRASLLMGTEPVWAVLVGVSLGGEHLTVVTAVGAVLIVGATYVGQHVERVHRLGLGSPVAAAGAGLRLKSANFNEGVGSDERARFATHSGRWVSSEDVSFGHSPRGRAVRPPDLANDVSPRRRPWPSRSPGAPHPWPGPCDPGR